MLQAKYTNHPKPNQTENSLLLGRDTLYYPEPTPIQVTSDQGKTSRGRPTCGPVSGSRSELRSDPVTGLSFTNLGLRSPKRHSTESNVTYKSSKEREGQQSGLYGNKEFLSPYPPGLKSRPSTRRVNTHIRGHHGEITGP